MTMNTMLAGRASSPWRRASWTALAALVAGLGAYAPALADGPPVVPPPSPIPGPTVAPGSGPMGAPPAPLPAPGPNDPQAPAVRRLTQEQLLELVGPIALYPDVVLAALLPATAFPLDVVGAARFARENKNAPAGAPADANWDASVQALMQYPDVLFWLDENIPWLQQMGEAIANQQPEVLAAIQEFRRRADKAGNLPSNDKQRVIVQAPVEPSAPQVIVIEPTNPEICYVPYYDPYVVVSPWWGVAPCISWGLGFSFGFGGPWSCHDFNWCGWNSYHHGYCGSIRSYGSPYRWHGDSHHLRSDLYAPSDWHAPHHGDGYHSDGATSRRLSGGVYAPGGGGTTLADASTRVRTPSRPRWGQDGARGGGGAGGTPVIRSGTDVAAPTVSAYAPRSGRSSLAGADGRRHYSPRTTRPAPKLDATGAGTTASGFRSNGRTEDGGSAFRRGAVAPSGTGPSGATSTDTPGADRGARNGWRWNGVNPGKFGGATTGAVEPSKPAFVPRAAPTVAPSVSPSVGASPRSTRAWGSGQNRWSAGGDGAAAWKAPVATPRAMPRQQSTPRVERSMPQQRAATPSFTQSAPRSAPAQPSFRSSNNNSFRSNNAFSNGGGNGRGMSRGHDYAPPAPSHHKR